MRKVETILLIITALSFAWLFIHWDGGSMLVMMSMFTLSFFYMVGSSVVMGGLSFREGPKAPAGWLGLLLISGLAISIILIGGMFRILMWEGGFFMTLMGITILAVMVLVGLIVRLFWKPKEKPTHDNPLDSGLATRKQRISFKPFFIRGIGGLAVGLALLFTPQTFWVYHTHHNVPEYRDALIDWMEDPDDEANQQRLEEFREPGDEY